MIPTPSPWNLERRIRHIQLVLEFALQSAKAQEYGRTRLDLSEAERLLRVIEVEYGEWYKVFGVLGLDAPPDEDDE